MRVNFISHLYGGIWLCGEEKGNSTSVLGARCEREKKEILFVTIENPFEYFFLQCGSLALVIIPIGPSYCRSNGMGVETLWLKIMYSSCLPTV
jgi:hypothetical protein